MHVQSKFNGFLTKNVDDFHEIAVVDNLVLLVLWVGVLAASVVP